MVDKAKFAKEDAMGYRLSVMARNFQVTEAMKSYVAQKIAKIERFHTHIFDIHVTLDIQKLEHACVIVVHFEHVTIKVSASSSDMYASVDRAVDRLQIQLRRWKERIQDHHRKAVSAIDMQVNVVQRPYDELEEINREIEEENRLAEQAVYFPPKVLAVETMLLRMLTTDEAVMKLELSAEPFLIYRGEEDQKLKVIYRRPDGHFGIVRAE